MDLNFLSKSFSFFPKNFFKCFLQGRSTSNKFPQFMFVQESPFLKGKFQAGGFFSFNTLNVLLHSLFASMVSQEKSDVILIPAHSMSHVSPPWFQDFLVVFAFLKSEYDMPTCGFFVLFCFDIYPACCSLSFLQMWFVINH